MAEKTHINNQNKHHKTHFKLTLNSISIIGGTILFAAFLAATMICTINKSVPINNQNIRQLTNQIATHQTTINKLQNELDNLRQTATTTKINWDLLEITHLIKKADLLLNTDSDIKSALNLLLLAKELAITIDDQHLLHALEKDIAALQTTASDDPESIIYRLNAISQQLANLTPIPPKLNTNHEQDLQTTALPPQKKWKRLLKNAGLALKDVFIIRHNTIEPLLDPTQQALLCINIQSKLLQAEWAVLHKNNKIYQLSLEQVNSWLTRYFALNSNESDIIIKNITALKTIDIAPLIPNINASLSAIHEQTFKSSSPSVTNNNTILQAPPNTQNPPPSSNQPIKPITSQGAKLT